MKTIDELKHFLIDTFPDAQITLFGSRARGDASKYSDVDVAVKGRGVLRTKLSQARFVIEESNIPYKVDLVNLSQAPYLENIVKSEGVVWH